MSETTQKPSAFWFALPIILGIVGGIIMYVKLRDRDAEYAKWGMIVGIVQTVIAVVSVGSSGTTGIVPVMIP